MAESKCRCGGSAGACGSIWVIGWLFTIGYLHLHFWPGVFAIIIWPYYLGNTLAARIPQYILMGR